MGPNMLRVLAVEDNPADLRLLKEQLLEASSTDFEVVGAGTLKEAIQLLPTGRFEVVLLDLQLPDSFGVEGIEKILAIPDAPPVIVLTELDNEQTGLQALSRKAQDYLVKGKINSDTLARSIRYAIQRDQVEKAVRWMNAELQTTIEDLRLSRLAALNLTEDAIHARQQAEQASSELARTSEQLRVTLTSIGDGVIAIDVNDRVTFINPVAAELTGWMPGESLGQAISNVFQIINEKTRRPASDLVKRARLERRVVTLANNTILVARDGREIPIEDSAAPILDEAGNVLGVVLVFHDVTEKRRADKALHESEERYRSLFNGMTEGFALHEIILDENGQPCDYRFLEVNPAFERLTGLKQGHIVGKLVKDVLPDTELFWIKAYGRVALTGQPAHFENFSAALNRHFEVFAYSPAPRQFAVIFLDVSERKQAQEMLQQQNKELEAARAAAENERRRLEAVMEALPVGVAITDVYGGSLKTNIAYELVWGGKPPQVHSVEDYVPYQAWWPETGRLVAPEEWASAQVVQKGVPVIGQLVEIQRFDGSRAFVINSASPVRDANGAIVGSAVAIQDVTELRKAEQLLRKAHDELELRVRERTQELAVANEELLNEIIVRKEVERQLRVQTTAMEAAANGILITDPLGNIQWANPALAQISGYEVRELLGQNTHIFKSGLHNADFYFQMWNTILLGQVWRGELTNRRKNGDLYVEGQTITPVRDEEGLIQQFIVVKQDITEQKKVEASLEIERLRLRDILDTMPDGVYIINQEYDIEYTNPVIEWEFGSVDGRKCFEYFHDRQEPCSWCKNKEVLAGRNFTGEQHYSKNDKIYELFDAPLVNVDGSVSKLKLLHDITERKRAEIELERRNEELQALTIAEHEQRQLAESLVEAAIVLNKSLKLDEVLAHILEQIKDVIPYQLANVSLLEGETFYDASHQGELSWPEALAGTQGRFPLKNFPLMNKMIRTCQPVLVLDTNKEPDWASVEGFAWSRSFLSAPLLVEKQVIGFVNLFAGQPGFFTQEMCNRLVAFAAHAAAAIQNAWLFEQVRASSERLHSLSRRLVEVQENERRYISRELHDEAGQLLTSLMVDLRLLEKKASQPDEIKKVIAEMEKSLNQVLENLHRVAMALRPASLDHVGLVPALSQHVEAIGEKHGLKVSFKSGKIRKRMPANVETVLYRIVQEALTNVVRHAHATRVDVVLTVRDDKLVVIVEDDGIGFDPEAAMTGEHLGLFGIRERAEMIDGMLEIESAPGKGTTLIVEVGYANKIASRR
jgi:PAS domain S-box-containing protein